MKTLKMSDLIRSIGLLVMLHMTTPIQAQVDAYALTNVNVSMANRTESTRTGAFLCVAEK